jgi:hypothetical protein
MAAKGLGRRDFGPQKVVPATAALMIVGLLQGSTRSEAPLVAGKEGMAIEEVSGRFCWKTTPMSCASRCAGWLSS